MTKGRFLEAGAAVRGGARTAALRSVAVAASVAAALVACGGGDNPLGNPPTVDNPGGTSGQRLSFVYYQKCINPILLAALQIPGSGATNTCAASGCHGDATGVGGAFRVVPGAAQVDLANPANTPTVARTTDMWKNFYSAQGSTVIGSPTQSNMLKKPLVQGVLHGGGIIFANQQDPNARLLQYWISRPVPVGQDEFSVAAGNAMFTPPDATTGACNSQ
jgi:predicted CxxxxCH...CXXCH cytochrome family protein